MYTHETLALLAERAKKEFVVEGLFGLKTLNFLVGGSGLGKTPFCAMVGAAVASGTPIFGRAVRQGPVLYLDAESSPDQYHVLLSAVSRHLGLTSVPEKFCVWSPNWVTKDVDGWILLLDELLKAVQPVLVVVDPLRLFWSKAESKPDEAVEVYKTLRKFSRKHGCAWLILHHRRKLSQTSTADLLTDVHLWFEEAAGSHALVNHSDTRLGFEKAKSGNADVVLAGFGRSLGQIGPFEFARVMADDGDPIGYRMLVGVAQLAKPHADVYTSLPERFRFKDAHVKLGGTSDSNTTKFLERCISIGILRRDKPYYRKINGVRGEDGNIEEIERKVTDEPVEHGGVAGAGRDTSTRSETLLGPTE